MYYDTHTDEKDIGVFTYDSKLAAMSALGLYNNSKNINIISKIRSLIKKLVTLGRDFHSIHVKGHSGNEYNEIADKKAKMEEFLLNQDWDERAKTMLERKDEWHKLGFFEQSDWKTKFFGIEKERFKMVLWK